MGRNEMPVNAKNLVLDRLRPMRGERQAMRRPQCKVQPRAGCPRETSIMIW